MNISSIRTQLAECAAHAIEQRVFPGCVIGVVDAVGNEAVFPFGRHRYSSDSTPMHENAIFDVASITKVVPTSLCALHCIDSGALSLNDRVDTYLHGFTVSSAAPCRIFHLLTHTIDFGFRLSSLKSHTPSKILETIYTARLSAAPGTRFSYSNATSIVLGKVVESVMGKRLDRLADELFFTPLNMTRTSFHPSAAGECVPAEIDRWRGRTVQGEVHDESAWALRPECIAGSAGLFSTVPDLLSCLRMILRGGEWEGRTFFGEAIIEQMHTNQIESVGKCTGLGWELNQERFMGQYHDRMTIGKTGFTGCVILANMHKGRAGVLLSNYTWPHRKGDAEGINRVRRQCADIIFR
jgi:CubicO group peptidase (beta-lactamase class C family)